VENLESQEQDTANEQQDTEAQSGIEQETACNETEKRYRRKSIRRQLQTVIDALGKVSKDPHQKPAKKVDALLKQSDLLLKLQEIDAEDRDQTLQEEHAALTAQHAADTEKIATLESENASLKNHKCETTVITRTDPEAAQLREQNTALRDILKQVIAPLDIDARARLAIRVLQTKPEHVARMFLPTIPVDYAKYRRLLNEYRCEQQLFDVLELAGEDSTGDLAVFARACLTVVHGVNVSSRKREKKEFDPAIFATLENRLAEVRAQRERLEAQRTS
jgi:hypothetical protein